MIGLLSIGLVGPAVYAQQTPSETQQAISDDKATSPDDYLCYYIDEPITIDGAANEPAWKLAPVLDRFTMPWIREGNRQPPAAARARLLWDRRYLYFLADLDDLDLLAHVHEHDGKTWNDDVFEMFVKPADDKPGYYEFQVNPLNTTLDMFLPRRGAGGYDRFKADDEFDFSTAVKLRGTLNQSNDQDRGWSVEGRIRWTDFARTGGRPEPGERWKYALCRYDYSGKPTSPVLSTTALLKAGPQPNFHAYEDYDRLKFVSPQESPKSPATQPYGIEKFSKLTTSRVVGSPDPPTPYTVERIWSKLPLTFPICLRYQPGTEWVWVITQSRPYGLATLSRFRDTADASTLETLLPRENGEVLYDICFHPNFAQNGYVYLGGNGNYVTGPTRSRITRYKVDLQTQKLDRASATPIIEWESNGHNGAAMAFGLDGMLYVTSGDGSSDSDRNLRGQDLKHLTSKVLRIDVDHPDHGKPYSVPRDNPLVDQPNIRPETWCYGLRNPWRIAVDSRSGQIWVGNNGQDLWEQVYLIERGANYGWSIMEGGHPFYLERQRGPHPISPPIADHPHSEARSLTGGVVCTVGKFEELDGAYLYGDFSTGKIWAIKHNGQQVIWHQEIADTALQISAFEQSPSGDVLVVDHGGGAIYKIVAAPADPPQSTFPRRLSESGLFKDLHRHELAEGVIPYSINAQLWADGATHSRFIAVPDVPGEDRRLDITPHGPWGLPKGTVLGKSFALELEVGKPASRRWIETQLMVLQNNEWSAYAFQWNSSGTDAELVPATGRDETFEVHDPLAQNGVRQQVWRFASRAECMTCHSRAAKYVLGLETAQMNCLHDYGGVIDQQLRTLEHLGVIKIPCAGANRQQVRATFIDAERHRRGTQAADPKVQDEINRLADQYINRQFSSPDQRGAPYLSSLLPSETDQLPRFSNPYDAKADLADRARAYLHVSCAHCHVTEGGGNSKIVLSYGLPVEFMGLVDQQPQHHTFGIPDARLIAPGSPDRSVLFHRMSRRGPGQMPQIATTIVDHQGVELIRSWIASIPSQKSMKNGTPVPSK